MLVTEAQPLVDYAKSSMRGITEEALTAMRGYVEEQLHNRGSIQISKDAGILISQR